VDRERESKQLLAEFRKRLAPVKKTRSRPRIYFEEWNEPLVSGIAWVSELIERAGGDDIFASLRFRRAASERVVSTEQVCRADPEVILASWCGKPVQAGQIIVRPGWDKVTAVRERRIHEIPSDDILQPGFRLVYGYEQLKQLCGEQQRKIGARERT
jgi:iron complex transport system substrate-binding protein